MTHSTKDNLIAIGVIGALILGSLVAVYFPQSRKLGDLETRIVNQNRELNNMSKQVEVVPKLAKHVENMKSRYANFDRRLPKRQELGNFLREITSNLSDERLSNQLIEPGKPQQEKLFHALPIIMRFKGSYLSLGAFLERIAKMERLTRVQRISITSPNVGDDSETLDIELQLNIYFTES